MFGFEAQCRSFRSVMESCPESMSNCLNPLVSDINHISLTEDLPFWVSKLGLLQFLLSDNRLNGSMDSVLASSTKNSLRKLVISVVFQNKLSGKIPSAAGDFSGCSY